ncbi:hypothetical protein GCM10010174_09580 [Kutzneria viridogrisea]|uniref:TniQ domain-containing protein n=1 Tax=Kutzneria viridogrisea TaxID=47990 RepID=A0ABR6BXU1_9PSEU|nr:hypothetical protein [Kutzneria viridogrisea]
MTSTVSSSRGVLPRSLTPLPQEHLPGFLLRLAHRLDLSPSRVAVLTGLKPGNKPVPFEYLLGLPPSAAAEFAHRTRVSASETAELCLGSLGPRYPALDLTEERLLRRQAHGVRGMTRWVLTQSTRYCPRCLAGDGSAIQQAHGGAWQRLWRLAPVFACTTHRCLLEHECPRCHRPAQSSARPSTLFLAYDQRVGLHPAQCRAPLSARGRSSRRDRARPCGARLDRVNPTNGPTGTIAANELKHLLAIQHRMTCLLLGPQQARCLGQLVEAGQYFLDLRLAIGLIRASWPAAGQSAPAWLTTEVIDDHVRQQHDLARTTSNGRHTKDMTLHGGPPVDTGACARLVGLADHILAQDPTTASDWLQGMLDQARTRPGWHAFFRACLPHTSTAVRAAITPARPRASRAPSPLTRLPRKVHRFTSRHIPQQPTAWVERHFPAPLGMAPEVLGRIVAVSLAVQAEHCGRQAAAGMLGLTAVWQRSDRHDLRVLRSRPADLEVLMAGIDAIADDLDACQRLIDYQRRREVLSTWFMPEMDLRRLALVLQSQHDDVPITVGWEFDLQRAASVLIWREVTCGDLTAPPHIRDDQQTRLQREQHARDLLRKAQADGEIGALYRDLIGYLHLYATFLATAIDRG